MLDFLLPIKLIRSWKYRELQEDRDVLSAQLIQVLHENRALREENQKMLQDGMLCLDRAHARIFCLEQQLEQPQRARRFKI